MFFEAGKCGCKNHKITTNAPQMHHENTIKKILTFLKTPCDILSNLRSGGLQGVLTTTRNKDIPPRSKRTSWSGM
jgi:hypothetical protein